MPASRIALVFCLLVLALSSACAEGPQPPQPGWIADAADVLTPQQEAEFIDLLTDFEARTTVQLVGVTVADLEGRAIEAYARDLARAWGVGQPGVNNGVIVLVALDERQVRVEVGYGMAWQIDDARTAEIIGRMTPHFQEGDYAEGLRVGFEQIMAAGDGVAWNVAYHTLADARQAGGEALEKIVAFEGVITKLDEDAADVTAPGGERARLLLPAHIDPSAFSVDDELVFHARIKEAEPMVLQVVGWEDVEAL